MNKIITLILCLCCVFTTAWADDAPALNPSDANIVGHILDKKTGEHLSFINVFLKGTTIGTSTDATGHYYLKNLPEGKYTLVMKTLGFKSILAELFMMILAILKTLANFKEAFLES